jgi:hypothetical protein
MNAFLRKLWSTSPVLVAVGLLHFALLVPMVIAIPLDHRLVAGALVWIKPAKFAISVGIYLLTLAWLLSFVEGRRRAVAMISWVTAVMMVVELAAVNVQAVRGVQSHFNVGTPFDAALFTTMGLAIFCIWLSGIATAVLLFRQKFADRAVGNALRIGMTVSMMGAGMGAMMTQPTPAQLAQINAGERLTRVGGHAVGGSEEGPGLPLVGWSTVAGDLRPAHFVGLHGMQLLPLLGLWLSRRRSLTERARVALVRIGAATYLGVIGLLIAQALRAEPLISPSGLTLASFGALFFAALVSVALVMRPRSLPSAVAS